MKYSFNIKISKKCTLFIWLLAFFQFGSSTAFAQGEFPKMPNVTIDGWMQGKKTTLDKKDTIYIVELWATWCGPCRSSLPTLSQLQTKYPYQKVHTVALSKENPQLVRQYLRNNRAKLQSLSIAADAKAYNVLSRAFAISAIPNALLIQNNRVLWQGHPAQIKPVLYQVLQGRWTPNSQQSITALKKRVTLYLAYWKNGGILTKQAEREGLRLLKDASNYPATLNNIAWTLLTQTNSQNLPLTLALRIAKAANDGTKGKDYHILDTYARSLYLNGDVQKAKKLQSKALNLCRAQRGQCNSLYKVLNIYQSNGIL